MYEGVLQALWEVGSFESIVMHGQLLAPPDGSRVGLYMSSAADIWQDYGFTGGAGGDGQVHSGATGQPAFGTATRALYIALLHHELKVDIVIEPLRNSDPEELFLGPKEHSLLYESLWEIVPLGLDNIKVKFTGLTQNLQVDPAV
jgi:hypothetical protein